MITKMVDFESEESVFLSLSAVWQEKNFYGENFRYRESGGCCSNREPPDQIERVGMFDFENIIHRSFVDIFSLTVLLFYFFHFLPQSTTQKQQKI